VEVTVITDQIGAVLSYRDKRLWAVEYVKQVNIAIVHHARRPLR
jgi:hypothetical protein